MQFSILLLMFFDQNAPFDATTKAILQVSQVHDNGSDDDPTLFFQPVLYLSYLTGLTFVPRALCHDGHQDGRNNSLDARFVGITASPNRASSLWPEPITSAGSRSVGG